MWKEYCTGRHATDNRAHALYVPDTKATNTHSQYVILIAFPLQQWFARTRPSFTLHVQHKLVSVTNLMQNFFIP